MTILSALRRRLSGRGASAGPAPSPGDTHSGPTEEAHPPFAGYARLDKRQVIDGLSEHSQLELEAVESYERSHESRQPVLDKLRYMRESEPLPGYDALSVEEIVIALKEADMATSKKVRAYERKFAHRPDVVEEVTRVHHRRLASRPAIAPPAYQPISAASAAGRHGDRTEISGRP